MKKILLALLMLSTSVMLSPIYTSQVYAQPASGNCKGFLTAPPWYRGLTDADCNIDINQVTENDEYGGKIGPFLFILGFNIIEILMHLVAYVSVGYIIFGGFKYITSAGSADGSVKARKTITNAVIGLVISLVAIGLITFVIGRITT